MGRGFEEKNIDGEIYTITMLRPRISLSILSRIIRIIGPSLGKAFPSEIKVKDILDADINVGGAMTEFLNKLDDKEVLSIVDILFTQVMHKGEGILSNPGAFDNCFKGKLKHLFKVVSAALGVQYADFLEGDDAITDIINKSKDLTKKELGQDQNQSQNQDTTQEKQT